MRRTLGGFTLIELLMAISVIATLTAILFPVFARIRESARRTTCASNMHQIGIAIMLYSQDNDERYPVGADSPDRGSYLWDPSSEQEAMLPTIPLLRDITNPYLRSHDVWHCPSDAGDQTLPLNDASGDLFYVDLKPTAYERLGTSYLYRLQLGMDGVNFPGDCTLGNPPYAEAVGSASLGILVDAAPNWHGEAASLDTQKSNILYADGHVHIANGKDFFRSWLCAPF